MRWYTKNVLCFLVALALSPTMSFAAKTMEAGGEWSKWSNETRFAYVSAYIHGQGRGFRDGCVVGEDLYSVAKASGLPGEKCVAKAPSYSKHLEHYVATITEYYHLYRSDQNVPIFKILEGLSDARNLSIQQMHDYFPGAVGKIE